MLKNNYDTEKNLDEGFLTFIDYSKDEDFSYEARDAVYQETKETKIPIIGLQADGIVNRDCYGKNGVPRILVLMYESYRINDGNLDYIWNEAAWLRFEGERPKKMFGVVHKWIKTLFEKLNIPIEEKPDNLLNYCAWMNISKLGRKTSKMDWRILHKLVQSKNVLEDNSHDYPCCAEKLTEQFLSYDPDIVICGNTEWLLYSFLNNAGHKELISERDQTNKNLHYFTYKVNGKDISLFNAYHPAAWARKTREEDFAEVLHNNYAKIERILRE